MVFVLSVVWRTVACAWIGAMLALALFLFHHTYNVLDDAACGAYLAALLFLGSTMLYIINTAHEFRGRKYQLKIRSYYLASYKITLEEYNTIKDYVRSRLRTGGVNTETLIASIEFPEPVNILSTEEKLTLLKNFAVICPPRYAQDKKGLWWNFDSEAYPIQKIEKLYWEELPVRWRRIKRLIRKQKTSSPTSAEK